MSEDSPVDEITGTQSVKEHFVRRGPHGGYLYPFRAREEDIPTTIETVKGFNLQETINNLTGPVVEVGGPSSHGFPLLEAIEFPHKPIITDILNYSQTTREIKSTDKATVDIVADVKNFPFANGSVGVLLASFLDLMDWKRYEEIKDSSPDNTTANKNATEIIFNQYSTFLDMLNKHTSLEELEQSQEAKNNPVISLFLTAKRSLENQGLLVMRRAEPPDFQIAQALGFTPVMHTPSKRYVYPYGRIREITSDVIFQKTD